MGDSSDEEEEHDQLQHAPARDRKEDFYPGYDEYLQQHMSVFEEQSHDQRRASPLHKPSGTTAGNDSNTAGAVASATLPESDILAVLRAEVARGIFLAVWEADRHFSRLAVNDVRLRIVRNDRSSSSSSSDDNCYMEDYGNSIISGVGTN